LNKMQDENLSADSKSAYEKLLTRTMFGIINASRNSV